jgi:glycosyltransferase involved in cell wall biosynthesis
VAGKSANGTNGGYRCRFMSEESSHGSVSLRVLARIRRRAYALLGGGDSRPGRLLGAASQRLGTIDERAVDRRRWRALRMPVIEAVDVSIVVVARSGAPAMERCLRAIAATGDSVAFETIVVDRGLDSEARERLAVVEGVQVLVAQRCGLAAAGNRGVARARGRLVVLIDDDVEPHAGWLAALVGRAESTPDAGAVAAKLLGADGNLAEAGAIVWSDGTVAGFGDGQRRDAPEYDYSRPVDSGALGALLLRRELWKAIGGFDERFESAGYVAADLGLAARAIGRTVLYEPRAVVARADTGVPEAGRSDVGAGEGDRSAFVTKWRAELEAQPTRGMESAYLASNRNQGPHVLIVDHDVPASDRDAGSLRMACIVDELAELGCRVTFMPDRRDADERYRRSLQDRGVEVLEPGSDLGAYLVAAGDRTRLAVLSRPHVASRYLHLVHEHAPSARVAYDTVDLHHVREQRRAEFEGRVDRRKAAGLRELELALARACDVTLVVSETERRTLLAEEPELDAEILSIGNEPWSEVPPRDGRSGVLFVGGFAHDPNRDAAFELAREVMPAVWQEIGDVRLTIVGADPPPDLQALAADRIDVRGWVPDLHPLLGESLLTAAPLRYGAGVKGKITESMAAGLPVVTTAIGAEGLAAEHGRDIQIGDTAADLARLIVELHRDSRLWSRLSRNGREVIARTASPAAMRPVLERLLAR